MSKGPLRHKWNMVIKCRDKGSDSTKKLYLGRPNEEDKVEYKKVKQRCKIIIEKETL
jgi:hypothetical protein